MGSYTVVFTRPARPAPSPRSRSLVSGLRWGLRGRNRGGGRGCRRFGGDAAQRGAPTP
jgi:hypothetical protein